MVELSALQREMMVWRRDLHQHPEFGFEEQRTAAFVAAKLRAFGLDDVVEGVGGTGVVGTLKRGTGNRSIALRADMDALRIPEQGSVTYRSTNPSLMHACGHDGHTSMLLGAAKLLAEEGGFNGTVRFVFQPAEETGQGALAMLADGLMERFPFEEIYGIHNMPGVPVGEFRTRGGAIMSAEDLFEITLRGIGGHASQPHISNETLVAACALVTNLQTIVSRRINPTDVSVVSVTELITDGICNALPGLSRILGDARSFRPEVSANIEKQMRIIAQGIALAHNVSAEVGYTRRCLSTINDEDLTTEALAAAALVFGQDATMTANAPAPGSEDFAQFLNHVPGCYAFIGNGEDSAPLHNPTYDFNDAALMGGAGFHVAVTRRRLPAVEGPKRAGRASISDAGRI
ncbi:amidohydrolase [Mesorhizobium sp. AR10]|uniref:amidohydrolase n=1 Tax=Mesorhizobium sp. AR10 TaxID=2865839 RepID=UPI00215F2479|nr:amidohydrolase [Mesorhizobium sp. AR10]UVK40853.1 amidohydrolase [Mesorhizobium sp. AR10]